MRIGFTIILLALGAVLKGQTFQLHGEVLDEKAMPLESVTVVLLNPSDSTMSYFAMTGKNGQFAVSNIKGGDYLLQISLITYKTIYRHLTFPLSDAGNIGTVLMIPNPASLNEVQVTGERVPVRIKRDTIEYNAKAFKTKPDAVAEDLIRKLPGMEVDRAGNIKALGEDVKNVLVDGKEFFGDDPKVATRNLPADAINKVQLFNKKSDESKFTGIDDGQKNQTLNLVLNEDKKAGIFGDVSAGAGTGDHVDANARIYKFTKKTQLAALGMFNNINQFGFSVSDFINFSGGMSALSSGHGFQITGDDSSFPVNFGQQVYGSGSNGAAGFNFSISKSENNRFFISYLGNGSERKLSNYSAMRYFKPDGSYLINENEMQTKRDSAHRFNFGWRRLINERQNILLNGRASYNNASDPLYSSSESYLNNISVNTLQSNSNEVKSGFNGNADVTYLNKINEGRTIFRLSASGAYSGSNSKNRFNDSITFVNPFHLNISRQYLNIRSTDKNLLTTISLTQKISKQSFFDLSVAARLSGGEINRKQGDLFDTFFPVDSLSLAFKKAERNFQPALTWKFASTKSVLSFTLSGSAGSYSTTLQNVTGQPTKYLYFSPRALWEYNYRSGRRLMIDYVTGVNTPATSQLLPVINNFNPLALIYGNRDLKPEYYHNMRLTWWLFDQFSFTTFLASINTTYTLNKINYSTSVDDNLRQTLMPVNVRDDWNSSADINFSTPLRPLGIKMDLALSENFIRGKNIINSAGNVNTNFIHRISLTFENKKKTYWDIETGSTLTLTDSRYSVQNSLNNVYRQLSWFAEIRYTPGSKFSFMGSADITKYSGQTFNDARYIPLLGTEISYYFLTNKRAVLSLRCFDLLNRNTGIERQSELSYLVEKRSDIIGRYVMVSFKYRLNKLGNDKNGIDIKVNRR